MSVDGRKQVLQAHLADGEEAIEGHSTDEKSFVVTERRLLVITDGDEADSREQRVETIPFDQTTGVLVDSHAEGQTDAILAALGGLVGALGLGSFAVAGGNTGGDTGLMMGLGFVGIVAALVLVAIAVDTHDGHTELTIQRLGSAPERSYTLTRDADQFAAEVSKRAAGRPTH